MNRIAPAILERVEKDCLGKKLAEIIRIVDSRTGIPEILSLTKIIVDEEVMEKSNCSLLVGERKLVGIGFRLAPLKNENNNTIGAILVFKKTA